MQAKRFGFKSFDSSDERVRQRCLQLFWFCLGCRSSPGIRSKRFERRRWRWRVTVTFAARWSLARIWNLTTRRFITSTSRIRIKSFASLKKPRTFCKNARYGKRWQKILYRFSVKCINLSRVIFKSYFHSYLCLWYIWQWVALKDLTGDMASDLVCGVCYVNKSGKKLLFKHLKVSHLWWKFALVLNEECNWWLCKHKCIQQLMQVNMKLTWKCWFFMDVGCN